MMTTPALAVIYPPEQLQAELLAPEADRASTPVLVPVALARSGPALIEMAAALGEGDTPRIYALHLAPPLNVGCSGRGRSRRLCQSLKHWYHSLHMPTRTGSTCIQ